MVELNRTIQPEDAIASIEGIDVDNICNSGIMRAVDLISILKTANTLLLLTFTPLLEHNPNSELLRTNALGLIKDARDLATGVTGITCDELCEKYRDIIREGFAACASVSPGLAGSYAIATRMRR